mgnify:CR=1 FL=1
MPFDAKLFIFPVLFYIKWNDISIVSHKETHSITTFSSLTRLAFSCLLSPHSQGPAFSSLTRACFLLTPKGLLYLENGDAEEARPLLLRAVKFFSKSSERRRHHLIFTLIDTDNKKNTSFHIIFFHMYRRGAPNLHYPLEPGTLHLAHCHHDLAKVYLELKRPYQAILHLKKANKIFARKYRWV